MQWCELVAAAVVFLPAFWKVAIDHYCYVAKYLRGECFCAQKHTSLCEALQNACTLIYVLEFSHCHYCWMISVCLAESYRHLHAWGLFTSLGFIMGPNVLTEYSAVLSCHKSVLSE